MPAPDDSWGWGADDQSSAIFESLISEDLAVLADRQRFRVEERLDRTRLFDIHLGRDLLMGRDVAIHLLRPDAPLGNAAFVRGVRRLALLQHPQIEPVYELDHTPEATPFYVTSQRLDLTLRAVLRQVAQDEDGARARWGLPALLDVLLDVARAVAFAHRQGVIHRDLRPAKIRIGHFGETLVSGWFRARRRQDDPDAAQDTALALVGSGLGYLAPERLEGGLSAAGVPADVWGLGALLYAILSRRPPFAGSSKEVAEAIRAGKVIPIGERARDVPEPLAALCLQALEFDPARRRVSADEFVSEIEDYLDGTRTEERRLEQAEERFEDAEQFAARYRGMRERLQAQWNAEAHGRDPRHVVDDREALDARLELDRLRQETEQAFYEADDAYMRVLSVMPGFDPAHYGLCALYYRALQDVERGRMRAPQHYLRASIRQLDPGGFTDALAASARLEVRTRPAGAGVRFHQYRNRGGVQTPDRGRLIGTTPLAFEELRPGDYVMVLEDERGRPFVLPVHLDPGEAQELSIRLPDRVPPGCVFIPDGPCRVGADGEPAALYGALPAGRVELSGYFIARDPVTFDEYAAFLNALHARDPARAARHAPRPHRGAPPLWRPGPAGYALPITGRGGQSWSGEMPVVGLAPDDIAAYLGWRSEQDGVAWRLPTELEWEKAARGAEGRAYPWGDRAEPAFCHHLGSDGTGPHLRPIGAVEADRSVYGVRDLAGGVREYTADTQAGAVVLRGGSWLFPFSECHLAVRATLDDATPLVGLGFRLATDGPMGPRPSAPAIVPEPDWIVPEPPRAGPERDESGLRSAELTVEGRSMLLAPAPPPAPAEDDEQAVDLYDTGPDRYTLMDEIARGSMGKVMLAYDRVLQRHVALKLLHDKHRSDKLSRYRFVMEARITGRLQHPTMVPVYDMGVLRGGQRFFAMKVIEGQSLQDVLRARSAGDRRALTDHSRDRLITFMRRVCQGVAFAHERHIVHRDLKPANILLGDFGEVCIVDLGLARQLEPDPSDMADVEEARELARADGRVTRVGSVIGTPYYMSPEQAMGLQDLVDERSDIYGLGAILYHVLAHRPPYSGRKVNEVLAKVRRGNPRPPSLAAPDQDIPRELDDIVLKSLAMDPRDRQASALDLAADLGTWQARARLLEKTREIARQRAARAVRTFSAVEKEQTALDQLRARLAELRDDASGDPVERRRRVVHQQEKIRLQEEQIEAHLALAVRQLRLALDAAQPDVRERLVALLKSRCMRAERTRDVGSVAYYAHLLRQVDDAEGTLARWLARGAPLAVHTHPEDLQVVVQRVVERKRRLEAGPTIAQGRTPVSVPDMPVGSGLATFTRHKASLRVPFIAMRDRPVEIELTWPDETWDGFVCIPGGRFLYGGDPLVDEGQAARSARIGTYHIAIHPVTCGEYNTWLESLAGEPEQRAARIPIMGRDGLPLWGPEGQARFGAYDPRHPVSGITLADAHAYAQWRSRRDGVKYRLPTSAEWEKAARGVDGRLWPWGDHYEPVYCRAPRPGLNPVGRFPHDVSPYGVRDLVTGVIEWTLTAARDDPNACYIRGGCSAMPFHGHPVTARLTRDPRDPSPFIGFRLVIASR
ncbi:MAG: SUMF1/EgtB/PvdO family nonheme iron enzyme [Myxococcales bacterium]|nr:SUMF1/EgtB/PvdO family nonheme iron enzyme [Myxococcales bacterium]